MTAEASFPAQDNGRSARKPRTPRGLEAAGRALWGDVIAVYSLRADEIRVLEAACRSLDTVAKLESALDGQPLAVKGSLGQIREHPLLSEARQQRAIMAKLLAQLHLPDVDGTGPAVNQHRDAAMSRWAKAHGNAS